MPDTQAPEECAISGRLRWQSSCDCEREDYEDIGWCNSIRKGKNGYSGKALRALCYQAAMAKWIACQATTDEAVEVYKAVGTIVVIAGVTYIVVQSGGGALILVPAGI